MTTVIEDITATGIVAIIRKEENNDVFSSLVATWFTTYLALHYVPLHL